MTDTTNKALLQLIHNEPSWCFGTAATRVALTRQAGMMAPVTFFADSNHPVQPYAVSPWWNEGCDPATPTLLAVLRGDFFCAPFGGNDAPFAGTTYPPHGQPANDAWTLDDFQQTGDGCLLTAVQSQAGGGEIRKRMALLEGHSVVYQRHDLIGMQGPICIGHHPNLSVPEDAQPGRISFAPHRYAHTYVQPTEKPTAKGYSMLKPDARIDDLTRCPTITGETTDLTRYPNRRGFEDIALISSKNDLPFAWTAFALPSLGYVWFSLKDPRVLASTLLWMSNGGRHFSPWNGRHVNTIGLEEITGFFHDGIAASAKKNFLNDIGIATSVALDPSRPLAVNFIQGVARISSDFAGVSAINKLDQHRVELVSEGGEHVEVNVELGFLQDGKLKEFIR